MESMQEQCCYFGCMKQAVSYTATGKPVCKDHLAAGGDGKQERGRVPRQEIAVADGESSCVGDSGVSKVDAAAGVPVVAVSALVSWLADEEERRRKQAALAEEEEMARRSQHIFEEYGDVPSEDHQQVDYEYGAC